MGDGHRFLVCGVAWTEGEFKNVFLWRSGLRRRCIIRSCRLHTGVICFHVCCLLFTFLIGGGSRYRWSWSCLRSRKVGGVTQRGGWSSASSWETDELSLAWRLFWWHGGWNRKRWNTREMIRKDCFCWRGSTWWQCLVCVCGVVGVADKNCVDGWILGLQSLKKGWNRGNFLFNWCSC